VLQAAELQQYAAGQKAQQQELQALQQAAKRHEEARSKAEVSTAWVVCSSSSACVTQHAFVLGLHVTAPSPGLHTASPHDKLGPVSRHISN
jgi:hypothetical protein